MIQTHTLALTLTLLSPLVYAAAPHAMAAEQHEAHGLDVRSPFVRTVRQATEVFRDVRNTDGAGYGPALGCVSGPEEGAMGVHYVNPQLLTDGILDATRPEALIYEFTGNVARLVGVEFIVFADQWHATHAPGDPPVLEGQLLHFVDSPNRFGLPAHYELHVWAWRDNPKGVFVDWNQRVSCDGR
ncbi:MAG: hypothetical protein ABI818_03780 [Acidobacteriota bacterium]